MEKNYGGMAGGIYSTFNKNVYIENIVMRYNVANKKAGGIYNDLTKNITITKSEFFNNTSILTTGGVFLVEATVGMYVTDSTFIDNFSYIYGGVGWIENSEDILFANSYFKGNVGY